MSDDAGLFPTPAPEPRPDRVALTREPAPVLIVTAYGIPGPQGSKTHVGEGRMIESSAKVKPWREAVGLYAMSARNKIRGWQMLRGPVEVSMVFSLPRPQSHYGTGRNAGKLRPSAPLRPDVTPDLDKLVRSTCDALKTGRIYADDALVVGLRAAKHYTTDHSWLPDVLHSPGCVIRLWPLTAQGEK